MANNEFSRRKVLQSAAVVGGLTVGGVGHVSATHNTLKLTIVPRKLASGSDSVSYSELFDVDDAIGHFFSQIEGHDGISISTDIDLEYDSLEEQYGNDYDFDHDGGCCDTTWFDNGKEAIKGDLDSYGKTDAFLLVSSQTNYAGASSDFYDDGHNDGVAYEDGPGFAWVGTQGDYDNVDATDADRYKNASIQETGHALIDHDVIDEGPSGDKEHALGRLRGSYPSTYRGPSTPMMTFYESSNSNPCHCAYGGDSPILSGDGPDRCSSNIGWDGYVDRDVTECTLDAIRATIDKHSGYYVG